MRIVLISRTRPPCHLELKPGADRRMAPISKKGPAQVKKRRAVVARAAGADDMIFYREKNVASLDKLCLCQRRGRRMNSSVPTP